MYKKTVFFLIIVCSNISCETSSKVEKTSFDKDTIKEFQLKLFTDNLQEVNKEIEKINSDSFHYKFLAFFAAIPTGIIVGYLVNNQYKSLSGAIMTSGGIFSVGGVCLVSAMIDEEYKNVLLQRKNRIENEIMNFSLHSQ
ncbi:MAG TPA: hypothetical protein VLB80_00310 [Candidatus Babeliales bacterium]|nr:hypothetical protein [Candidatus Babeliales bacterium]